MISEFKCSGPAGHGESRRSAYQDQCPSHQSHSSLTQRASEVRLAGGGLPPAVPSLGMGPKDVDGRARRASSVLSVKASVTCKNGKAWRLQNKSNSPSPSEKGISRIRQGSNLRGETPTDILILKFKSVALTTRPRMLCTLHRKLNLYTENSKNIYWLLVAWHHRLDDAAEPGPGSSTWQRAQEPLYLHAG